MEQVERASGDIAKWLKSLRLGDEGESIGGELLDPKQVIIPATSFICCCCWSQPTLDYCPRAS